MEILEWILGREFLRVLLSFVLWVLLWSSDGEYLMVFWLMMLMVFLFIVGFNGLVVGDYGYDYGGYSLELSIK